MRPLLASLPFLLALAPWATAAAPPASMREADRLDYLFLGSDRPVLIRLHVRVGDKAYGAAWSEFMDRLFAWFDKDKDGFLSPAEVARLPIPTAVSYFALRSPLAFSQTVPFADIDANKDGKVSREEFLAYYRSNGFADFTFLSHHYQATQVKQLNDAIIERLDPKGDGKLTAAKVAGMYEKLRSLDENEDEIITPKELTNGIGVGTAPRPALLPENGLQRVQPGQTGGLVKGLLAKYDRNKDGKLSRKEIGLGEAAFSRLDADKDGFLGPAELGAYLADEPDFVLRLQLGAPTAGKGILGRMGLGTVIPVGPRLTLVNEKTIDPALGKKYRRGPDDSLVVQLGDTKMLLQIYHEPENGRPPRNGAKESYLNLYDIKAGKKGHVTRADLAEPAYPLLLSIFSQADKDADGKLTRVEIINWLDFMATASDMGLTLLSHDLGRSLFEVLDADGDGGLSVREMRTAWKRLGPLAKGGALGHDDLPRTMYLAIKWGGGMGFGSIPVAGVPTRGRPGTPVWFRKMDRNNDGDVSRKEWLGTDEDFAAIDTDGDGLISVDEALAFEAKKKKKDKE